MLVGRLGPTSACFLPCACRPPAFLALLLSTALFQDAGFCLVFKSNGMTSFFTSCPEMQSPTHASRGRQKGGLVMVG